MKKVLLKMEEDKEIAIDPEETEADVNLGYEMSGLWTKQEGDQLLESTLEQNMMLAEAQLARERYSIQDLEFALTTIVVLKNFLIKYNPERDKGPSDEIIKTERVLDHFQDDPLRYIRALNGYIIPILRSRYGFGLKFQRLQPWQKKESQKVS